MTITAQQFSTLFSALELGADYVPPLLERLSPRRFADGERLVSHGWPSDTLFFIVNGNVEISLDVDGRRLELGRIGSGRWVGEFGLIDPAPASATLSAVGDVSALALDQAALQGLHDEVPAAASDLLVRLSLDLARRLRDTSRQQLVADGDGFAVRGSEPEKSEPPGPFVRLGRLLGIGGVQ